MDDDDEHERPTSLSVFPSISPLGAVGLLLLMVVSIQLLYANFMTHRDLEQEQRFRTSISEFEAKLLSLESQVGAATSSVSLVVPIPSEATSSLDGANVRKLVDVQQQQSPASAQADPTANTVSPATSIPIPSATPTTTPTTLQTTFTTARLTARPTAMS